MKVVIGGATGFLGSALAKSYADDGHEVVALVRGEEGLVGCRNVRWDGRGVDSWASELDGADAVFNLAGSPIAVKWTQENLRRIEESRLDSARAIAQGIERAARPPKVYLAGSAVGYYGDTGERAVDERAPAGLGYLGELSERWEAAAHTAATRVVFLRTGVVLGTDGGMLPVLTKLTRGFLGGALGDGSQYIPWIHLEDHVRMMRWLALSNVEGPVNLCAPRPVTNGEFMTTLRRVIKRPWSPPAPKLAVEILGRVAGPDPSLALMSSRVVPWVAMDKGFHYRHPDLEPALKDLLAS